MQELNSENYKTFLRKITENLKKWRDIPCLCIKILNIVTMSVLPQIIYRFNIVSIILSESSFLIEFNKLIIKFVEKYKESKLAKTILRKKNRNGELYLISRLNCKAAITKTVWCGCKHGYMDQ